MNLFLGRARSFTAGFMLPTSATASAQGAWRPLFNGKDLTGWTQLNGTAPYTVADGAIVGATVTGSPNSFLGASKEFGDGALES